VANRLPMDYLELVVAVVEEGFTLLELAVLEL
jgi:hypothetical protein